MIKFDQKYPEITRANPVNPPPNGAESLHTPPNLLQRGVIFQGRAHQLLYLELRGPPKLGERGVIFSGIFRFFGKNHLAGPSKGGVKGRGFWPKVSKIDTQIFETQKGAKITRARLVGRFLVKKGVKIDKMPCRFLTKIVKNHAP